jgi:hypothetical protein
MFSVGNIVDRESCHDGLLLPFGRNCRSPLNEARDNALKRTEMTQQASAIESLPTKSRRCSTPDNADEPQRASFSGEVSFWIFFARNYVERGSYAVPMPSFAHAALQETE